MTRQRGKVSLQLSLAPYTDMFSLQGCLQYAFGTTGTGTIQSYNFNAGNGIHLANQNVMHCIRREKNMVK